MGLRAAGSSSQKTKGFLSVPNTQENIMRRTSYVLYSATVACALLLGACGGPAGLEQRHRTERAVAWNDRHIGRICALPHDDGLGQ